MLTEILCITAKKILQFVLSILYTTFLPITIYRSHRSDKLNFDEWLEDIALFLIDYF